MIRCTTLACSLSLLVVGSAHAIIVLNDADGWTGIRYNSPSDYLSDQQTGQPEADMVGQPGYASLYKAYDNGGTVDNISDDNIGFRIRVSSDEQPTGFTKYAFVGIDADNNGSVDVFVGGNQSAINFYSPGTGLNISPNTTTVDDLSSSDTYNGEVVAWNGIGLTDFSAVSTVDSSLNLADPAPYASLDNNDPANADLVTADSPNSTTADLDGAGLEDYFFSFEVSMSTLIKAVYVSTELNPNKTAFEPDLLSPMSFLALTSTQDNSYNQDLNGQDGDTLNFSRSDLTWEELGADSNTYTADGETPIPEPAAYPVLFGLLASFGLVVRRRRLS